MLCYAMRCDTILILYDTILIYKTIYLILFHLTSSYPIYQSIYPCIYPTLSNLSCPILSICIHSIYIYVCMYICVYIYIHTLWCLLTWCFRWKTPTVRSHEMDHFPARPCLSAGEYLYNMVGVLQEFCLTPHLVQ